MPTRSNAKKKNTTTKSNAAKGSVVVTGGDTLRTLSLSNKKVQKSSTNAKKFLKESVTPKQKKAPEVKRSVSKKSASSKKSKNSHNEKVPTVTALPTLISVSLDEKGAASVSRYAGLFFIFFGLCFAIHSLSVVYGESVELGLHTAPSSHRTSLRAELITALSTTTADSSGDTYPTSGTTGTSDTSGTSVDSDTSGTSDTQIIQDTQVSPDAPPPQDVQLTDTNQLNTDTSSNTATDTKTADLRSEEMQPPITVTIREPLPVSGYFDTRVDVRYADLVELIVVPHISLREQYLGKARKVEPDRWLLKYDSTLLPNGEYKLFARVHNKFGSYRSDGVYLRVKNPLPIVVATTTDIEVTKQVTEAEDSFDSKEPVVDVTEEIIDVLKATDTSTEEDHEPTDVDQQTDQQVEQEDDHKIAEETSIDPEINAKALGYLLDLENKFNDLLERYAVALRTGDESALITAREALRIFENQQLDRIGLDLLNGSDDARIAQVRDRFKVLVSDAITRTERRERLIVDRVGDKVTRDSDRDGVSDYDEINLYYTDPYAADSDKDGFPDGAEILAGYDPNNDNGQVTVAYEDPKVDGVVRDDVLSIDRLDLYKEEATAEVTEPEQKLLFSGKALPSSFITLYIFSTPVVVTVKTNRDGTWSYAFDKELDDGEHTVYIGMTDNEGVIVAKSKPFTFVKQAEAYTIRTDGITAAVTETTEPQQLFSQGILMLIFSLGVIMMGLVLVILGVHFSRHTKIPEPVLEPVV